MAVVGGVNASEGVLVRKSLVESRRAKILADVLLRTAE